MHRNRTLIGISVLLTALSVTAIGPPARATIPGKNGRIAFTRYFNDAHTRGAIFTIRPDGTGLIQVTHRGGDLLDIEPDWSPNGGRIAFYRDEPGKRLRIFKIRPNGTHLTRVSHNPCTDDTCADDLDPVWSPDGRWIAVTRYDDRAGLAGIFMMRPDGADVRLVTTLGKYAGWSPDGKRLVFQGEKPDGRAAVFTVRRNGTDPRRLTPWRLHAGDHPDWSPDGRWIVFRSHVDQDRQGNVYLVHPNGTGLHRITHTFTGGELTYLSSSFSPDGTKITVAFTGVGEPGNPDVWVMNLDGSGFRNVTTSVIWDSRPDWGSRPE